MKRLQLKCWVGLALAGALVSCGGGGQEPAPLGGPVIHSDSGATTQSFPADAPISVQVTQWQQINVTITKGMTLTMTVDATGSPPLEYTWWHSNKRVPGATEPRLVIANIQETDQGKYTVSVANQDNRVTSQAVSVTVVPHVDASAPSTP